MRSSKALAKMRANQPVRLCALGHFVPAFIQHAAAAGYDAIWLDLEHRAMSDREVQALLAYFHTSDIDCMLRPATLEKTRLYRYLEDGATGLMVPHVSTAEKAQYLVDCVKFPPIGDRGLDGAGFDSRFLLDELDDYVRQADQETFLVVQIETPEAVANVDQIAAVEGIDGLFVGPGDLGLRIRRTETELTLEKAFDVVAQAADRHGKAWGCPAASKERVAELRAQGAQLIAYGSEFRAFMTHLRDASNDLSDVYGSETS